MKPTLTIYSPAGIVTPAAPLRRALRRLAALGFDARLDADALARRQRFAGDDERRLAALHRVAAEAPSIAMASRGGYGLTRLLDRIDWPLLAQAVERGTRWVGYSDLTALQLGLLAHTGAPSWAGPMAAGDFGAGQDARAARGGRAGHAAGVSVEGDDGGRSGQRGEGAADDGVDEITRDVFCEAMDGALEAVGFRTEAGFDGMQARGTLWGGNLTVLCSLLGTPHFPRVRGGVLFIEEVGEHPYRVERMLLQLHQAGVLGRQKALLVGAVSGFKPSPLDRGYGLRQAIAQLRSVCTTPVLTGLPFGHVPTKVCLPVGRRVELLVQGRDVLIGWAHDHA
jgi:muramoyltetrapeptide carboxypeptidase